MTCVKTEKARKLTGECGLGADEGVGGDGVGVDEVCEETLFAVEQGAAGGVRAHARIIRVAGLPSSQVSGSTHAPELLATRV